LQGGAEKHESETYETLLSQGRLRLHRGCGYTGPFLGKSTELIALGEKAKKWGY